MASSTSTTNSTTDPPQDLEEQIRTTLREAFAQRGYPNPVESADIGDTFAWSQFYAADGLPAAAVYRYRDKRLMANTVFKKTREAAADYNQRAGGYPEYIAIVANSNIKNGLYMDTPGAEGADPPTATRRIFKDSNLTFNPLKHKAVSVHERLSADEFDRLARDSASAATSRRRPAQPARSTATTSSSPCSRASRATSSASPARPVTACTAGRSRPWHLNRRTTEGGEGRVRPNVELFFAPGPVKPPGD